MHCPGCPPGILKTSNQFYRVVLTPRNLAAPMKLYDHKILIRFENYSLCVFLYSGATPMYCAGCEKFPAAFEAKNYY